MQSVYGNEYSTTKCLGAINVSLEIHSGVTKSILHVMTLDSHLYLGPFTFIVITIQLRIIFSQQYRKSITAE